MTAHVNTAPAPLRGTIEALGRAARAFGAILVNSSHAMRCNREAERLFRLSDGELARLGLTRDRIVHHAFARYLAS